jgi:WD40 repeat protein
MIPGWIKKKPKMQPEWDACLLTLEGHDFEVYCLAFSPDSRIIASSDRGGIIKIWDLDTGACLNTRSGRPRTSIYKLAFLPQEPSTVLASAGEGSDDCSIKIWDPFNASPPRTTFAMPNLSDFITFIAGSKTAVLADQEGTLTKLDLDTGASLDAIKLPTEPVAVSPDGQTIITFDGDCCQVWDWGNPETDRFTLDCYPDYGDVVITPDSTRRLVCAETTMDRLDIEVWDLSTGACATSLSNVNGIADSLAFSPDGTVVTFADSDGTVYLWDTTTDTSQAFSGHSDAVRVLAISPDARLLASGCDDKTIKIWDPTIKAPPDFDAGANNGPRHWLLSPNGLWVASMAEPGSIRIWSSVTSEYAFDLREPPPIWDKGLGVSPKFSPCDRWLACQVKDGSKDGIKVWDTTTWRIQDKLKLQRLTKWEIPSFSISSNNLAFALGENVDIWDLHTGKLRSTLSSSLWGFVSDMSFSPNGLWLAVTTYEKHEIWDWATKERKWAQDRGSERISWHSAHDALLHTSHSNYCVQGSTGNRRVDKVQMQEEANKYPVQMTKNSEWVTVQGKRVLWIPSQYRPRLKDEQYYHVPDRRAMDWNKSGIAMLDNCNRVIYVEFDVPEIALKF